MARIWTKKLSQSEYDSLLNLFVNDPKKLMIYGKDITSNIHLMLDIARINKEALKYIDKNMHPFINFAIDNKLDNNQLQNIKEYIQIDQNLNKNNYYEYLFLYALDFDSNSISFDDIVDFIGGLPTDEIYKEYLSIRGFVPDNYQIDLYDIKNNMDLLTCAIKQNAELIETLNIDKEIFNDLELSLDLVKYNYKTFPYIHDYFESTCKHGLLSDFNRIAISENEKVFEFAKDDFTPFTYIDFVAGKPKLFLKVKDKFLNDFYFLSTAFHENGEILKYAPEVNNNRELVKKALKSSPHAIKYASEDLKYNKEFILECITGEYDEVEQTQRYNFGIMEYLDDSILDEDFILRAIEIHSEALWHLKDDRYLNDFDYALKAVKVNSDCYEDVCYKLIGDDEFLIKCLVVNPSGMVESIEYNYDHYHQYWSVNDDEATIKCFIEAIKINEIVFAMITIDDEIFRTIKIKSLENNYKLFNLLESELKEDESYAIAAIKNNAIAYLLIPNSLKENEEFNKKAVEVNPKVKKYINKKKTG